MIGLRRRNHQQATNPTAIITSDTARATTITSLNGNWGFPIRPASPITPDTSDGNDSGFTTFVFPANATIHSQVVPDAHVMTARIATVSTAPPTPASRNARTLAPTDSPARLTTNHTTNGKHNAADAFNAIATAMSATPAKNPPNTAGYVA